MCSRQLRKNCRVSPDELEAIGLGLDKGVVRLVAAEAAWSLAAASLIEHIGRALGRSAVTIEHIGSTAVPGLLTKPIIDVAVRLVPEASIELVVELLETAGWEYRGDAGDAGGLVFVLSTRPNYRVAHLHAIPHDDAQWRRYLAFRERLRADSQARSDYETVKRQLAETFPNDQAAYTIGKDDVVARLRQSR
jgi:GrpB-like predicted nucleotidyltransferase (UPF0157 family)